MTVSCNTNLSLLRVSTELQFAFYKDGQKVQEFSSSSKYQVVSADLDHSGKYSCEVNTSTNSVKKASDGLYVQVEELFSYPEIKVTSYPVTEGDGMSVLCDTRRNHLKVATELQFAFYKNGHNVQEFSLSSRYQVVPAQQNHSGNYSCDVKTSTDGVTKTSNELHIKTEELFLYPEIKMNPNLVTEGAGMTLSCDTTLRVVKELQFAFYKNGNKVQEFNSSNSYRVVSAQVEYSGDYSCEVKTPTHSVTKRSKVLYVKINERKQEHTGNDHTQQNIIRLILSPNDPIEKSTPSLSFMLVQDRSLYRIEVPRISPQSR
ncbi:high affinity immunoglobulin gamma Fc receptor I-like [Discoglossus pictus]